MTRIVLYTEQPVLGRGLQAVLESEADMAIVATCGSLAELAQHIGGGVDLFLVEATPGVTLEAIGHLTAPPSRTPVLLWVESIADEFVSQAVNIGVRGILRKALAPGTLIQAIREVAVGGLWIEKELSNRLLFQRPVPLTARERQLVTLLAQGLKNKEIAWTLGITEGTVKVYLSRLFQKVGANDRFELALYALKSLCSNPSGEVELMSVRHNRLPEDPRPEPYPIPRLTSLPRVHKITQ